MRPKLTFVSVSAYYTEKHECSGKVSDVSRMK